jgi:HEAT repeat protein
MWWWTQRKMRSPDATTRRRAVEEAAKSEDPRARAALVGMLRDPDVAVRLSAMRAIGRFVGPGDPELDTLLAERVNDKSYEVREAVMDLVRIAGGDAAVAASVARVASEADYSSVLSAIVPVLMDHASVAVPLLTERLGANDSHATMRCAWALGLIGEPGTAEALSTLVTDERRNVRHTAVVSLATLGAKPENPVARAVLLAARRWKCRSLPPESRIVDFLANTVCDRYDSHWRERVEAALTLGELGDTRAIEPLARRFSEFFVKDGGVYPKREWEKDAEVCGVAEALTSLDWKPEDGETRRLLTEAVERGRDCAVESVNTDDAGLQETAIEEIGAIGTWDAVPPLIESMRDKKLGVAIEERLIKRLGDIRDPRSIGSLAARVGNAPYAARPAALAVGMTGDVLAVGTLKSAFDDAVRDQKHQPAFWRQYGERQEFLATALGMLWPHSRDTVLSLLEQRDWSVRAALLTGLGESDDPSVLEIIREFCCANVEEVVQAAACTALGRTGNKAAVGYLLTALDKSKATDEAIAALGEIGAPEALERLMRMLTRERDANIVVEAVGKILWKSADEVDVDLLGKISRLESFSYRQSIDPRDDYPTAGGQRWADASAIKGMAKDELVRRE